MSVVLSIALYFIIWWTMLFAILPFGVRTQGEAGEIVPGTPAGAPVAPRLLWVAGVNTIVSLVVFLIVRTAIVYEWIPLSVIDMSKH